MSAAILEPPMPEHVLDVVYCDGERTRLECTIHDACGVFVWCTSEYEGVGDVLVRMPAEAILRRMAAHMHAHGFSHVDGPLETLRRDMFGAHRTFMPGCTWSPIIEAQEEAAAFDEGGPF